MTSPNEYRAIIGTLWVLLAIAVWYAPQIAAFNEFVSLVWNCTPDSSGNCNLFAWN